MIPWMVGAALAFWLFAAAMISLYFHHLLPEPALGKETGDVLKLGVGMIVAMSTLVLGLLTASSKSTFDTVNTDVRKFATELLLMDRTFREYGPDAAQARADLLRYTERALDGTWPDAGQKPVVADNAAEGMLDRVSADVYAFHPSDEQQRALAASATSQIEAIVQQRWTLIEEATGSVSPIMVGVLFVWLGLTFASFGYNAPRNRVVVATFLLCAVSIGGAMFLILEMDGPFDGLISISPEPVTTALHHMRQPDTLAP